MDRRELRRAGRSYTVETLREARAEFGAERPLALLVGPDQKWLTTMGYLEKVDEYLNKALG